MTDTVAATRTPSLWRHRDFMLLWAGQTVSEVGSQITVLALPLVAVVLMHASTLQVGLLSAAQTSVYLLVSLPAGALVGRFAKRRVMLWCDVARLLLIGSVPVAAAAGVLSLGRLYAVALVSSAFSVFFSVAYPSVLPTLLTRDQLMDGNGKLGTTQSFAQIAGPGLGAGLVAAFGAASAMTGDALTYLASAGGLLAMRGQEPPIESAPGVRPRLRDQMRARLANVVQSWTFSSTVCSVGLLSYRQATCPPELLAPVNATARWINWGTLPLGGIAAGALGSALGVRATLWIAVVGGCASGLWLFFSPLRGLPDFPQPGTEPEPAPA